MQMQTPTTIAPKVRPRSGRTPLQPKNTPAALTLLLPAKPKPKPDQSCFEITLIQDTDKENRDIVATPPLETSLAEELSAIKKKLERLKADKEKTEKTLKEREEMLDMKMKEMEERGQIQKNLEIQVDRLFRLKELKYRCMVRTSKYFAVQFVSNFDFDFSMLILNFFLLEQRVSPIRTLREKEHEKIVNEAPSPSEVCYVLI